MPKKKSPTSTYVTHSECAEISGQIRKEITVIKNSLVGEDMRGGLVKDVESMKNSVETIKTYIDNEKTKGRDWRLLGFAVTTSVFSGAAVAIVTYLLHLYA